MKIGLFFGSFNPIHVGHLIIGNFMAYHTDLEQVWFIVSPQNPFKERKGLAPDRTRLHMVHLAIQSNPKLRTSDIEFGLPKPSYTIDTLVHLNEKYPQHEFVLIMGGDNISTFDKWKNYELILKNYSIYVYDRPGFDHGVFGNHPKIKFFEAPQMNISATFIRQCIQDKKPITYLVSESVEKYIESSILYRS
jgi:nicotinate-nucleotide adenylyltransferase